MKIKITLRPKRETGIVLPMHYNYMLQSFIYRNLDKVYSYFLHNSGFNYKKDYISWLLSPASSEEER